ncbi:MAG: beta strand repeat-containing protein, partial [Isosphaeraceae bacterium]
MLESLEGRTLLSNFTVTSTGDSSSGSGNSGTLRYCINQAVANSSIEFELGMAPATITLSSGQLALAKSVTIYDGSGQGPVTVSGSVSNPSRVFQIDSGVKATLSGLTITGGSASTGFGGGLYSDDGTLNMTDCTISGNSAKFGGGLLVNQGTATLIGCTIAGNYANDKAGGLDNYGGTVTFENCTISGNTAKSGGGGVFAGLNNSKPPTTTLIETTDADNSATSGVGGLYNQGTATLTDTIVAGNSTGSPSTASDVGGSAASSVTGTYNLIGDGGSGGISNGSNHDIVLTAQTETELVLGPLGSYGGPTKTIPLVVGNPAVGAGVIADDPGTGMPITTDQRGLIRGSSVDIGAFQTNPLVINTTVDGTTSPFGDLSLRQAVNLANVLDAAESITFSTTVFGTPQTVTLTAGQLELSAGTVTITGPAADVTISGGGASRVFQIDDGVTATITGLTITGGSTSGNGGGILNYGNLTITDSTLTGNTAAYGGAILTKGGSLSLADCTIAGNTASISGGGIEAQNNITVIACTFSDNVASPRSGGGGAIDNFNGGEYTITIGDSILSGDSCVYGPEVANAVISLGHNLVSETDNSSGWVSSDLKGTSSHPLVALLGSLGAYGGSTQTIPLLPGSPAIGAGITADYSGTTTPITTDQRGEPLDSPNPDIGAFQSQGFTLTLVNGSSPQAAPTGTAFPNPLAVTVTAKNSVEPVAGGIISFSAPLSGASAVLSSDSATIGSNGAASITATAGATGGSFVVTGSVAGTETTALFDLTDEVAPVVTSSPSDQSVVVGQPASFSASADGIPNASVQWQIEAPGATTFSNISGATSTTYTFTPASSDDGDQFQAVFTNAAGSVTSNAASLQVLYAPIITTEPASTSFNPGDLVTFTAAAAGDPQPTVLWQQSADGGTSWTSIAGATSPTYRFNAPAADAGDEFRALFTNSIGSTPTSPATLILNTLPVVTSQPANTTVAITQSASFTAAATGTPAPTVQWQFEVSGSTFWADIPGATSTTYSFTPTGADSGTFYRAAFTNGAGTVTTSAAELTVGTTGYQHPISFNQALTVGTDPIGGGYSVPVTLTGQDPNNHPLTYSVISGPTYGTLSGTAPNLTYYPPPFPPNGAVTDSFAFEASNAAFAGNVATVTLNVVSPPTPIDQHAATLEDTPVAITLTATSPGNLPLTDTVTNGPFDGTVSGTAPNLTYTPDAGFVGTDSFSYEPNDGYNNTLDSMCAVFIHVGGVPTANSQTVTVISTAPEAVTLGGSDPTGLSLTYAIVTQPNFGTLSGTAPDLTYTPSADFPGADSFAFTVSNSYATSAPASVTITQDPVPQAIAQTVVTSEPTTLVNGTVEFDLQGASS